MKMNNKKKIGLFMILMCLCFAVNSKFTYAKENLQEITSGNYVYTEHVDGIAIVAYHGKEEQVVVPSEIDHKRVMEIKKNAFRDCTKMQSIVIPDTVYSLEDQGIVGCSNLKTITFPGTMQYFNPYFLDTDTCQKVEAFKVTSQGEKMKAMDGVLIYNHTVYYPSERKGTTYEIPKNTVIDSNTNFKNNKYIKNIIIPATSVMDEYSIPENIKKVTYYGDIANETIRSQNNESNDKIFIGEKTVLYAYKNSNIAKKVKKEGIKVKYLKTPKTAAPANVKVSVKKKNKKFDKVTVTWKAASNTKGCEIQNSADDQGIITKAYKTKKTTRSYTFKVKRNRTKKIKVTVRNYRNVKGVKTYSNTVKTYVKPNKKK